MSVRALAPQALPCAWSTETAAAPPPPAQPAGGPQPPSPLCLPRPAAAPTLAPAGRGRRRAATASSPSTTMYRRCGARPGPTTTSLAAQRLRGRARGAAAARQRASRGARGGARQRAGGRQGGRRGPGSCVHGRCPVHVQAGTRAPRVHAGKSRCSCAPRLDARGDPFDRRAPRRRELAEGRLHPRRPQPEEPAPLVQAVADEPLDAGGAAAGGAGAHVQQLRRERVVLGARQRRPLPRGLGAGRAAAVRFCSAVAHGGAAFRIGTLQMTAKSVLLRNPSKFDQQNEMSFMHQLPSKGCTGVCESGGAAPTARSRTGRCSALRKPAYQLPGRKRHTLSHTRAGLPASRKIEA
jgi:hypothetical protein